MTHCGAVVSGAGHSMDEHVLRILRRDAWFNTWSGTDGVVSGQEHMGIHVVRTRGMTRGQARSVAP